MTKRPLIDFCRNHKMNRYRVRHRILGNTAEVSAKDPHAAASRLGWIYEESFVVYLGKKPILKDPKRYVRIKPKRKGGDKDD